VLCMCCAHLSFGISHSPIHYSFSHMCTKCRSHNIPQHYLSCYIPMLQSAGCTRPDLTLKVTLFEWQIQHRNPFIDCCRKLLSQQRCGAMQIFLLWHRDFWPWSIRDVGNQTSSMHDTADMVAVPAALLLSAARHCNSNMHAWNTQPRRLGGRKAVVSTAVV
jgi:hypothetical protein